MEIEVKINATAKEVFDELVVSLQEDIKNSTGNDVSVEELGANYSYKKKLMNYAGNNVGVSVKIDKLVYPKEYCATISNPKGESIVEYNLEDLGDAVNIKYKENHVSTSIFQKANNMIMTLIFTRSNKKKMIKRFEYLEKQIINKRTNS